MKLFDGSLFNWSAVQRKLKHYGKVFLWLLVAMLLGAFIGCGIASGNPFAIFFPGSWIHLLQFLS